LNKEQMNKNEIVAMIKQNSPTKNKFKSPRPED
jgi:hypothetical protein